MSIEKLLLCVIAFACHLVSAAAGEPPTAADLHPDGHVESNLDVPIAEAPKIELPKVILRGLPHVVVITSPAADSLTLTVDMRRYAPDTVTETAASFSGVVSETGIASYTVMDNRDNTLAALTQQTLHPLWSIVPAVMSLLLALVFRQVIAALFVGVWVGAVLILGISISNLGANLGQGAVDVATVYTLNALADVSHASVILFTLLIGGLVGVLVANGGVEGLVRIMIRFAHSARRGRLVTFGMGLIIFFDDYANSLTVGQSLRPVTDRLGIAREKLAYIVDSTAAPVAGLALISTWIGFQVGLIDTALAGSPGVTTSGYEVFLHSLKYNFYAWLALLAVFWSCWSGRDFKQMHLAELRTAVPATDAPEVPRAPTGKPAQKQRGYNALLPLGVLTLGTVYGIYVTGANAITPTGSGTTFREIVGASDPYTALIGASLGAILVAAAMTLTQRLLTITQMMDAWMAGAKSMLLPLVVLVLAWSLASVNETLHTATYLAALIEGSFDMRWLPGLVFVLAAIMALAMGSSWGVMGILLPVVMPVVLVNAAASGFDPTTALILYSSVAAVLAGAVMGDHCSPISDTTVLASAACECDHINHVRTQLPYALVTGAAALGLGYIPSAFGVPWWVCMAAGGVAVVGSLQLFGKVQPDEQRSTSS